MAVRQKSVVANALKAGWNSVLQEPSDELVGREGHHLLLLPVAVMLPLEGYPGIFKCQQTPIGNSPPMSVTGQIYQPLVRSAKGGLRLNHPLVLLQQSQLMSR